MADKAPGLTEPSETLYQFDAVTGSWYRVAGRAVYREPSAVNEEEYEERMTDHIRAAWLANEAKRITRERRENRINVALGVLCVVAFGVLVAIAIGVLR